MKSKTIISNDKKITLEPLNENCILIQIAKKDEECDLSKGSIYLSRAKLKMIRDKIDLFIKSES